MLNKITLFAFFLFSAKLNCVVIAQKPLLIEFGWDYPDVNQLSEKLTSIQNTPFDGICFSLQRNIMEAFDSTLRKESYFESGKLKQLKWGRYRNNFIILRGVGKTGGQWFNDITWQTIIENMKGLSKAMSFENIKGILFDPEYYLENPLTNPWTYNSKQYPEKSLYDVQAQVRKRGFQFINALENEKPGLVFLSLWVSGLIAEEMKYMPFEKTLHCLLPSFIEGMLEGKNTNTIFTDGNEMAFWYKMPSQFATSSDSIRKFTGMLMKSKKAKQEVQKMEVSQPVFFDGLMAKTDRFEKGFDNATKWKWLAENCKYAMASSNRFTWFYSERLNWWDNTYPKDSLIRLLQECKEQFETKASFIRNKKNNSYKFMQACNNVNESKGYYYFADEKEPMKTAEIAFTYNWNIEKKTLQIISKEKTPKEITVFINNKAVKKVIPGKGKITVPINSFIKGKLVILAQYENNIEAIGIMNL